MEIEQPSILEASEPVSRAINEISKTGLPVFVLKDGKYFGTIDERSIRQRPANPAKEKCGTIAERTPSLKADATVLDACNAFFAGRFKAIPVIENGKIQGAITRHTLLSELLTEKMLSKKRVGEVMTSPVVTIDAGATVGQARSELRRNNIRRLVVTKGGKIAGILSVFDLAGSMGPKQSSGFMTKAPGFNVSGEKTSMDSHLAVSYMKKEVEKIPSTEPLSSAVKKMLEQRVAALIVSEGSYPVGIVTAKDILHAALASEQESRVFVSGLPYEQREFQEEMVAEGEKLLSKLGRSFAVASLAFHVKSDGSGFSIRARLDGKFSVNASASDYRIEDALHRVMGELKRMVEKGKGTKIARRKSSQRSNPELEEGEDE